MFTTADRCCDANGVILATYTSDTCPCFIPWFHWLMLIFKDFCMAHLFWSCLIGHLCLCCAIFVAWLFRNVAIARYLECRIWHFCFLMVLGFYTLMQEPYCVREVFFSSGLCECQSHHFTYFSPFVVRKPVLTCTRVKVWDSTKHCKRTKERERLYLFLYRVPRLILLVR